MEAAEGQPITERVDRDWQKQVDKLKRNPAAAKAFLLDGAAPRTGTIHCQPNGLLRGGARRPPRWHRLGVGGLVP
jgi:gamma-glutamyltranspeptidase / glutathione hydrolase